MGFGYLFVCGMAGIAFVWLLKPETDYGTARLSALMVLPHYELEVFRKASWNGRKIDWGSSQAGFHRANSTNPMFPKGGRNPSSCLLRSSFQKRDPETVGFSEPSYNTNIIYAVPKSSDLWVDRHIHSWHRPGEFYRYQQSASWPQSLCSP